LEKVRSLFEQIKFEEKSKEIVPEPEPEPVSSDLIEGISNIPKTVTVERAARIDEFNLPEFEVNTSRRKIEIINTVIYCTSHGVTFNPIL
jgi:hypothetical protein